MPKICFKTCEQVVEFHNPIKNGELDRQKLEVRLDPLTEHQSILCHGLKGKISVLFPETDYTYLQQRIQDTKNQCFMCDGRWRMTSPRYPERIIPEGRLIKGETVLFPNLFPLAPYHAVVMVGEIGGDAEERLAEHIVDTGFEKPVFAYIAGRAAPREKRMGHAGAIIYGNYGTAESKISALRSAGVGVAMTPMEVPLIVERRLGRQSST